jgi:ubiquinone/menaquinone biosynthesis C-methylase UbiE
VVTDVKQQQRASWDSAAPAWEKWDNWMQRQTHTITDWICRSADARSGNRILDIASGSGQPALTLARLVRPGGSIVATDLSPEMLRIARRKANQADMDNIEFQELDAEHLDFPDDSFDAVTCRWGLMFCPDPAKAISEARRVLKPNRPYVATTWADPEKNPFLSRVNAVIGQVAPEAAPPPGALGPLSLPDPEKLKAFARDAGFQHPEVESRPLTFEFASLDEVWQNLSEFVPPVVNALSKVDDAKKEQIKSSLLEELSKYREGGKVRLPALALGLYGQK